MAAEDISSNSVIIWREANRSQNCITDLHLRGRSLLRDLAIDHNLELLVLASILLQISCHRARFFAAYRRLNSALVFAKLNSDTFAGGIFEVLKQSVSFIN
ncbi:hypothetical protein TNCV_829981 [Trichonephila clavipes]|nr:hypothetical protein TNCV_829981 [Trichonephila clavipes]